MTDKYKATITNIKDETHDTKTFTLKLDKNISFIPGQYAIFNFPKENKKRPFTFSNAPNSNNIIKITVKKMKDFTLKLFKCNIKDKLELEGPFGKTLNFDKSIKKDVVFIAGGSGITPFMSALRYANKNDLKNNLTLIFSNKTKDDIIYKEDLKILNKSNNINIIHTLTQKIPKNYKGETGYINSNMISKYVDNIHDKIFYICGPPPMIDKVKEELLSLNIKEKNLRIENWQLPGKEDI